MCILLGADVVDWLFNHIQGFQDRKDAKKYATLLLKAGYIRHTVNKITFSEQCYYAFGDLSLSKLCISNSFIENHPSCKRINFHIICLSNN